MKTAMIQAKKSADEKSQTKRNQPTKQGNRNCRKKIHLPNLVTPVDINY